MNFTKIGREQADELVHAHFGDREVKILLQFTEYCDKINACVREMANLWKRKDAKQEV